MGREREREGGEGMLRRLCCAVLCWQEIMGEDGRI